MDIGQIGVKTRDVYKQSSKFLQENREYLELSSTLNNNQKKTLIRTDIWLPQGRTFTGSTASSSMAVTGMSSKSFGVLMNYSAIIYLLISCLLFIIETPLW